MYISGLFLQVEGAFLFLWVEHFFTQKEKSGNKNYVNKLLVPTLGKTARC